MEKIIIHVGVHKTATTSMQKFFENQQAKFLDHDVRYFPLRFTRKEITPLIRSREPQHGNRLTELLNGQRQGKLLLSDENILGNAREIRRNRLYTSAETRLRRFMDQFERVPIHMFLTLRSPANFIASMYCEYLRNNPFVPFDVFTGDFNLQNCSYRAMFGWIRSVPANVRAHVIPFEEAYDGGPRTVLNAIVRQACGDRHTIDLAAFPSTGARAAFSSEEIDLFQMVADQAGPETVRLLATAMERSGERFGAEKFAPLSQDMTDHLEAEYRKDLDWFARS